MKFGMDDIFRSKILICFETRLTTCTYILEYLQCFYVMLCGIWRLNYDDL